MSHGQNFQEVNHKNCAPPIHMTHSMSHRPITRQKITKTTPPGGGGKVEPLHIRGQLTTPHQYTLAPEREQSIRPVPK